MTTDEGGAAGYGIHAAGAYAPADRIAIEEVADAWGSVEASGIQETAVPAADEDALTMASEAARLALSAAGLAGDDVDYLGFATTTPPLAEEDLTVRLGSFLGVKERVTRQAFTGSTRAGTRALVAALDAEPERGLVIASDCPRGEPHDAREHAAGAGAAAFLVGPDAPAVILDRSEYAEPYPGTRFRGGGEDRIDGIDVTSYDREAFTATLAAAVEGFDAGPVDAAAVQAPDGALPYRAAEPLGVSADEIAACETVSELGDTGAASVPLSVARALGDGHDRVLAAAHGSGAGADGLVIENDGTPTELALEGDATLSYSAYLRRRGEITAGEPEGGGAYVSVPTWTRSIPQRHRLVAGRCPDCGALAFPPEGACPDCGALVEFTPVQLPGAGTVETATKIGRGGAPPEFAELQSRAGAYNVTVVAFDGLAGRETSAPAQVVSEVDGDGETVEVGDRVTAVIRQIYTQEGVPRYGFKVRPGE